MNYKSKNGNNKNVKQDLSWITLGKERREEQKEEGGHAWELMQHLTNVTDWRRQDIMTVHVLTWPICESRLLPYFTVAIFLYFTLSFFLFFFFILLQFSCFANLRNSLFFSRFFPANVVIIYSKCWGRKRGDTTRGRGSCRGSTVIAK